jgi:tRNA threonylcarbamoyladenosine biosynthesis protein TsaB
MILAIETSAILCSVAFWKNGKVLQTYNHRAPMQHATLIGQLVEKGLKETPSYTLEAVAVAIGPGSFTGLRIGLSYAQGFSYGRNLPIFGISNHQVLAMQSDSLEKEIYTIIDARRDEVYLAKHNNDNIFSIKSHEIISKIGLFKNISNDSILVIQEDVKLPENIIGELRGKKITLKPGVTYDAVYIAQIASQRMINGQPDDLEQLEPMYIRPFAGVQ